MGPVVAVDTETMGLNPHRDRLCLVQLSAGDGMAHLVQLIPPSLGGRGFDCPNLSRLLADPRHRQADALRPLRCGRAAARARDHRGAGEMHQDRRQADAHLYRPARAARSVPRAARASRFSKQQQTSDWGAPELTPEQLAYAAADVLHLHALWARLEALLMREHRLDLAEACFAFLPTRARLDLLGYADPDVFAH